MATSIDFTSLQSTQSNHKSAVFGYIRSNFTQTNTISSENIINYTILAFYHDNCDVFSTFLENYDISPDGKCLSGCGYGKFQIDPSDKRYNRYQWMIKINSCIEDSQGVILGIASKADTKLPWCYALQPIQYNFHNTGEFLPAVAWEGPEYDHLDIDNEPFEQNDIVILDLNTKTREFKLFINGEFGGCRKDVNCDRDTRYRLACLVSDGVHFVTIEGFSKFKDNEHDTSKNLLNYKGGFTERKHPNNRWDIDYDGMQRIGPQPDDAFCELFRYYEPDAPRWRWHYYREDHPDIFSFYRQA